MDLLQAVTDSFPVLIHWIRKVSMQLVNSHAYWGKLQLFFWIPVAIAALFLGIRIVRSFIQLRRS